MLFKTKYRVALEKIKELENNLIQEEKNNVDKQWKMLCRISDLIKEVSKLEKENRQFRENSNSKSNVKRTGN